MWSDLESRERTLYSKEAAQAALDYLEFPPSFLTVTPRSGSYQHHRSIIGNFSILLGKKKLYFNMTITVNAHVSAIHTDSEWPHRVPLTGWAVHFSYISAGGN